MSQDRVVFGSQESAEIRRRDLLMTELVLCPYCWFWGDPCDCPECDGKGLVAGWSAYEYLLQNPREQEPGQYLDILDTKQDSPDAMLRELFGKGGTNEHPVRL